MSLRILTACLIGLATIQFVSAEPTQAPRHRQTNYIRGVEDDCGPNNPLFVIVGNDRPVMEAKICQTTKKPGGKATRTFTDNQLGKGVTVLGCRFTSEKEEQSFSIHWLEAQPFKPPQEVTDAGNDVVIYYTRGHTSWTISNRHYFKAIKVTYTFRGRQKTEVIKPLGEIAFRGVDPAPQINKTAFVVPYAGEQDCLAPKDKYPPIKIGPKSKK